MIALLDADARARRRTRQPRGTCCLATDADVSGGGADGGAHRPGTPCRCRAHLVARRLSIGPSSAVELARVARAAPRHRRGARRRRSRRPARSVDRVATRSGDSSAATARAIGRRRRCSSIKSQIQVAGSPTTNHQPTVETQSQHDLVERVLDDALAAGGLELRESGRGRCVSSMIVFTATQSSIAQRRDGRPLQRRQQRRGSSRRSARADVEHEPDASLRLDRRAQQQRDVLDLGALPRRRPAPSRWRSAACSTPSPCRGCAAGWRAASSRSRSPRRCASASTGGLTSVAPQENSTLHR